MSQAIWLIGGGKGRGGSTGCALLCRIVGTLRESDGVTDSRGEVSSGPRVAMASHFSQAVWGVPVSQSPVPDRPGA